MGPQRLVTFVISALEMFLLTYLHTETLFRFTIVISGVKLKAR